MSAARPKKVKVAPSTPSATVASSSTHATVQNPAILRQIQYKSNVAKSTKSKSELKARMPTQSRGQGGFNKGKGKAIDPNAPISVHSSSEDDDELEEVQIPGGSSSYPGTPNTPGTAMTYATTPGTMTTAPSVDDNFDEDSDAEDAGRDDGVIRLEIGGETEEDKAKRIALESRKKPMTSKDRAIRLEAHKLHVVALLASARIRNRWCSNMLLKARLLSLLPHPLQAAFNIPPSRFPDRAQRSRLFFEALQSLTTWWSQTFFDVSDPMLGMRTRPWDEVQEVVDQLPQLTRADMLGSAFGEKPPDWSETAEVLNHGSGGERLRTPNSLMKKVLQQEGSRDVMAQLFVSLARACGLGARLVISLQPVPWRAEKVVVKKKPGAGRKGRSLASRQGNGPQSDGDSDDEDMEEVPIPSGPSETGEGAPGEVITKIKNRKATVRQAGRRRHQDPADVYRLRKPVAQKVGAAPRPKPKVKEDLSRQPPVFWAEVFSRSDQRWIPVDPVAGIIRKKAHYEPQSDSGPIRLVYVVAFEEDGFARDVTLRYTKNFGAKTIKLRVPPKKDEPEWWPQVMVFLQRPIRLRRDELEDAEFETSQVSESMPLHMNGFKDHPIYVLERHLKREEVIQPKREIGRFKGEPVFRRANVLSCKTAENWMRGGRRVKERQEPMKWVKQRAVTLQKRRAQELAVQETGEGIQQALYAEHQTEVYIPPPIKDGIIPQNTFGNIDLYAPTMLPKGAVHLPYKGIAKIAKALKISYAEACTGFEFKKQRAIPVITGIVVAEENEDLVLDAYQESAAAAEERERIKKEEKALKRWVKLINGLRVRARLQAQYGTGEGLQEQQHNPLADPKQSTPSKGKRTAAEAIASANQEAVKKWSNNVEASSESDESMEEVEVASGTGDPEELRSEAAIEPSPSTETLPESTKDNDLPIAQTSGAGDKYEAVDEPDEHGPAKHDVPLAPSDDVVAMPAADYLGEAEAKEIAIGDGRTQFEIDPAASKESPVSRRPRRAATKKSIVESPERPAHGRATRASARRAGG